MSKLIDKEQLAKLAQGLDARMKAAVKAEEEARVAAVQGIEQAMETEAARVDGKIATDIAAESALRVAEEGKLAQAVADEKLRAEGKELELSNAISGEVARAEGVEAEIRGELTAAIAQEVIDRNAAIKVEADRAAGQEAAIRQELADAIAQEVLDRNAAIEDEKERAEGKEGELLAAINKEVQDRENADNELSRRIAVVEGFFGEGEEGGEISLETVNAAIEKAQEDAEKGIADAAAAQAAADKAQDEVDAVELRVDALEAFKNEHKHDVMEQGIAANAEAIEQEVEDRKAAIEGVQSAIEGEASARAAAETEIRKDFAAADAQVLVDAKAYADQEITKLVDSAPEAMNTLNELAEAISANKGVYDAYVEQHATAMAGLKTELQGEIDSDIAAERQLRVAEEQRIAGLVATEQGRAEGVEANLQAAIEAEATVARAAEGALEGRIKANEDWVKAHSHEEIEGRLDDVEAFVTGHSHEGLQGGIEAVEGRVDALETFKNEHSHATMEQGIADNKAAIEKEVEDRAAAIEEALKVYSTTEQVKAILGNVVNSLALTMENDKVVLKLGGVDGIALTSVSLDLATDADIEAILGGLDTPAAE